MFEIEEVHPRGSTPGEVIEQFGDERPGDTHRLDLPWRLQFQHRYPSRKHKFGI